MSPEFDDEERSRVHKVVDEVLARTKTRVMKLPIRKPILDHEASEFYHDRMVLSLEERRIRDSLPKDRTHKWVTIVKGVPLQRRCEHCRCLLTVFASGAAAYQMPGDNVTTRRP